MYKNTDNLALIIVVSLTYAVAEKVADLIKEDAKVTDGGSRY